MRQSLCGGQLDIWGLWLGMLQVVSRESWIVRVVFENLEIN